MIRSIPPFDSSAFQDGRANRPTRFTVLSLNIYTPYDARHANKMTVALKVRLSPRNPTRGPGRRKHNLPPKDRDHRRVGSGGQKPQRSDRGHPTASQTVTLVNSAAPPRASRPCITPTRWCLYVWGGAPGVGFDCSGTRQWAWARPVSRFRDTTSRRPPMVQWRSTISTGDLLFTTTRRRSRSTTSSCTSGSGTWGRVPSSRGPTPARM